MSLQIQRRQWQDSLFGRKLTAGQWAIAMALSGFLSTRTGQCNPSISTLAHKAVVGKNTAIRALSRLAELGLIRIKSPGNGRGNTAEYSLILEGEQPVDNSQNQADKGTQKHAERYPKHALKVPKTRNSHIIEEPIEPKEPSGMSNRLWVPLKPVAINPVLANATLAALKRMVGA